MTAKPARAPAPIPGPAGPLPTTEDRIARTFGDFQSLAVMQGTILDLAQVVIQPMGLPWDQPTVQNAAIEYARALREAAICEHAIEVAILAGISEAEVGKRHGERGAYAVAFVNALTDGNLDLLRDRITKIRGQAQRSEQHLWALRRVFRDPLAASARYFPTPRGQRNSQAGSRQPHHPSPATSHAPPIAP